MMPVEINRRCLCLFVLVAIMVPAGIGLWYCNGQRPRRVNREHAKIIAKEFEYLARRIDFSVLRDTRLGRRDTERDLDELEWLLENRYSYLKYKGVDYKTALDAIRCSLGDGINRSAFGYQLSKFIALFGDGTRSPLQVLLPFFMAENDVPRVVNLAKYRLGTENIEEDFKARYLFLASSPHWSEAERDVVSHFASTFQPEWTPPREHFSEWHYFVISPTHDQRYYHYTKPVVVLMDRWNFSACDIFLGAFKGLRNITLMGQPSGGGSGCYQIYRLRNSHIRIHLSSMASFQPNGKLYDGNGIQPDIVIEPVPTDFIGRTDSFLDRAIELINSKNISLQLWPGQIIIG